MDKLIYSDSYEHQDAPVSFMHVHSRGVDSDWMQKRAAVLSDEIAAVRPEPGKTHLHLIALGDTETFGPNRNADGFSKQANIDRHHTFVTNGHVYKDHQNKDPRKASGIVKASAHNDKMGRVELVISVDNKKWEKELQKVASGKDIAFSMAANLPHDVCNICDNKARSRAEYCDCMKKMAGQTLDDGRKVFVDNPHPTYFDISGVFRPADRTAFNLQKIAGASVTTGAELAELAGWEQPAPDLLPRQSSRQYFAKLSTLRKLSDIEKAIEASACGDAGNKTLIALGSSFDPEVNEPGLSEEELDTVSDGARDRIGEFMSGLANVQISLPLKDFLRILLGKDHPDTDLQAVKGELPGIFTQMLEGDTDAAVNDGSYDTADCGTLGLPGPVKQLIGQMVPGLSLESACVEKRSMQTLARKSAAPMLTQAVRTHSIKSANTSAPATMLAQEYAKYKLSLLTKVAENVGFTTAVKLGVLQNYM